ncbi:NUDIX domain-containing protein [Aureibacillus halotolerans]|uniref:ADP-ribose pyrophosphatase YjhB (NUDIX family) n=1 Tax=Aureibacillus halotolerans TaxID=1508390 RepID=A0A4R6U858_9BACI|nr:NUDIX domain-containing protein [Aureibacillus halotolerans]TDQ41986.1 ADP-ribose pyrophosphatase YjhB (NUDIX family) [Aureibacillus halotolerans]
MGTIFKALNSMTREELLHVLSLPENRKKRDMFNDEHRQRIELEQRIRSSTYIHIAFSSSEAGTVRVRSSQFTGGRAEHVVISIPDEPLEFGPLTELYTSEGQKQRGRWCKTWLENDQYPFYAFGHPSAWRSFFESLALITAKQTVIFWLNGSSHSQTGFLCVQATLADDIPAATVKLHEKLSEEDFNHRHVLGSKERAKLQEQWSTMLASESTLRAMVHGELLPVPDTYYDDLLLQYIKEAPHDGEWVRMGDLLGEIYSSPNNPILSFAFLYHRIRALAYEAKLTLRGLPFQASFGHGTSLEIALPRPYRRVNVVYGLIMNEVNDILMVKNRDRQDWSMPGGMVEDKEPLQEALVREVKEETGLIVDVGALCSVNEAYLDDGTEHCLFFTFNAKVKTTISKLATERPHEIEDVCWMPLHEAERHMPYHPYGLSSLMGSEATYHLQA